MEVGVEVSVDEEVLPTPQAPVATPVVPTVPASRSQQIPVVEERRSGRVRKTPARFKDYAL